MNFNETNTISVEVNELLQKRIRFIAIMQQIWGVLIAISGGICCIGIITAVFGVPILLAGIKLFQSGSAFSLTANTKKGEDLVNAITGLHGYWKFTLISFIILIVFYIILFIVMISLAANYSHF